MNQCKPGDKLLSFRGTIFTYGGKTHPYPYPHLVFYPDGHEGTRTDDGQVFSKNKLPEDEDIVSFAPSE